MFEAYWNHRRLTGVAAALSCVLAMQAGTGAALAQDGYPDSPVEIVIPYPPGGSDTLGRRIAETASKMTGADLVVMNVPGASTQVASRQVANADPDGYRLYIASPPEFVAGPVFYENLPFDPQKDFTLITYAAEAPYLLLVDPKLGPTDYAGFEAFLRENPEKVRFGSYGALSQSDIIARRFRKETGIEFDIIPYSGGTPAFNALLSGEIQALFGTTIPTRGFIKDKQMIPMAATTSARTPLYPDVPTLTEVGVDLVDAASYGLVGPAGLPQEVVDYWQKAWSDAMNEPETKKFVESMGVTVIGSTPAEFQTWLTENSALWASFPEDLGLTEKK